LVSLDTVSPFAWQNRGLTLHPRTVQAGHDEERETETVAERVERVERVERAESQQGGGGGEGFSPSKLGVRGVVRQGSADVGPRARLDTWVTSGDTATVRGREGREPVLVSSRGFRRSGSGGS
jgi:hypothetical protein